LKQSATAGLAQSVLFVPGDRPERFEKAATSGADLVIIDLEDAVGIEAKAVARDAVHAALSGAAPFRTMVRVNSTATPWHDDDIRAIVALPGLAGVLLPKVEEAADLEALDARLGKSVPLHALVETVGAVLGLAKLCAARGLRRVAFGTIDFQVDSGIEGDGAELDAIRTMIVLHSRQAGLEAPLEGVTTGFRDLAAVRHSASRARRFGFGGKLCIHPEQVSAVNEAFRPTDDEIAWARRIIATTGSAVGSVSLDGQMIDKPIVEKARRILSVQRMLSN
jgi:citrate lyase subunit beta/citryl-CoA lyase